MTIILILLFLKMSRRKWFWGWGKEGGGGGRDWGNHILETLLRLIFNLQQCFSSNSRVFFLFFFSLFVNYCGTLFFSLYFNVIKKKRHGRIRKKGKNRRPHSLSELKTAHDNLKIIRSYYNYNLFSISMRRLTFGSSLSVVLTRL